MHILLIHQAFTTLDEPGGTRHYELARFLAREGHRVSVIASPVSYLTGSYTHSAKVEEDSNGMIKIYRTYTYSALHKSFIHRVLSFLSFMVSSFFKSLSLKKVDIVWGTTPPIFQSVTAWLVSKIRNIPFLLEVRDLWPEFAIEVGVLKDPKLIKMSYWLENFLYTHADRIIVNSPGFIDSISQKTNRKITLIPNGSDITLFDAGNPAKTREDLGWTKKFIFLYAGAFGMSNDLGIIINTAKILEKTKEIQFVLIGDGKEKSNLIIEAESLKLTNITFLDPFPKNKMAEIFSASDACIAILKPIQMYKTTYPNKVFDYMAARKPVILAIDGVIREVVEKAGCGVFVKPGDANAMAEECLNLYNDKNKAINMGEKGYQYLKIHFDRENIARELLKVLNEMVTTYGRKNINR
jgi:glycosyltransferase involved in cell wall biosynthesis